MEKLFEFIRITARVIQAFVPVINNLDSKAEDTGA
jgi:hypothetical protein